MARKSKQTQAARNGESSRRAEGDTPERSIAMQFDAGPHGRLATAGVCAALALAVAAVFGQTVGFDFVNYDDDVYVTENLTLARGLNADTIRWACTTTRGCTWGPLTWMSYLLDFQISGFSPWGYHLTNVVLHAVASILLFLTLQRMTGDFWPAAFTAAIFAVHPLRAESVAWVAERKDVLSGVFFMLTLGAYARYVQAGRLRHGLSGSVRYLAVLAFFACGLMSKPMLVTLPLVLLLLDVWPLAQKAGGGTWRLCVEKIPLFLMAAASCAVTLAAQNTAIAPVEHLTLARRLANAVVSSVGYLISFFYPENLAAHYPYLKSGWPVWNVAAAAAILAAVTLAAMLLRRRCPYLLVGWFWYLAMLTPVIGLVQVGSQRMADRYTYLPQIGLAIALAYGAAQASRLRPEYRRWWSAAAAAMLATLTVAAWCQTTFWANGETLWRRVLDCGLESGAAHGSLGAVLMAQGRIDEAAEHFRKAVQHDPGNVVAYCNLGTLMAEQGRLDEAVACFQKAMEFDPRAPTVYCNLGLALENAGRRDEAMKNFREAEKIDPDGLAVHTVLGAALLARGRFGEAVSHLQKVAEARPNYVQGRLDFANALAKLGRLDEAKAQYKAALALAQQSRQASAAESARAGLRNVEAAARGHR